MLLASGFYLVGGSLEVWSGSKSFSEAGGLTTLMIGRYIYGFGIGFATHGAPTYISEMAPDSMRGALIAAKEAMIAMGMVFGYMIGDYYSRKMGGWQYVYAFGPCVSVFYGIGVYCLPYSARWLVLQGRKEEAKESLKFIYGDNYEAVHDNIVEKAEVAAESLKKRTDEGGEKDAFKELMSSRVWPATMASIGVVILQQITGQPSVLYYAATIFEKAGVASSATIAVGWFKVACTSLSARVIDSYGRRKLLKAGIAIMTVSLATITAYFAFDVDSDMTIIGAMFLYVGGYQIGFGPIAWLLIAEMFPLDVRGEGMALGVQANFFFNLAVSLSFSTELDLIGNTASFGIFGGIAAFAFYFVHRYVPETKGLSLEKIEAHLDNGTFTPAHMSEDADDEDCDVDETSPILVSSSD